MFFGFLKTCDEDADTLWWNENRDDTPVSLMKDFMEDEENAHLTAPVHFFTAHTAEEFFACPIFKKWTDDTEVMIDCFRATSSDFFISEVMEYEIVQICDEYDDFEERAEKFRELVKKWQLNP